MGAATPTRLIDNERVRVTEWRFKPGEATGWHRHEYDYVVVPVTTGKLTSRSPTASARTVEIVHGSPYFPRGEGVEHDVINPSDSDDVVFIEVEMK